MLDVYQRDMIFAIFIFSPLLNNTSLFFSLLQALLTTDIFSAPSLVVYGQTG